MPPNEALQPTSVAELGRSAYVRLLVEDGHDDKDTLTRGIWINSLHNYEILGRLESLCDVTLAVRHDEIRLGPDEGQHQSRKHGVSFDEGATVFLDPMAVSGTDPNHSLEEDRSITFGVSRLGRLLAVCHTYRPGAIRIINARRATRGERKLYEEG